MSFNDSTGIRVMVFDGTFHRAHGPASWLQSGLTISWHLGSMLYRLPWYGLTQTHAAMSLHDALSWLAHLAQHHRIDEIQYWGHGLPGRIFLGAEQLTVKELTTSNALSEFMDRIALSLHAESLIWFRTCATAAGVSGQEFMTTCAERFGCRIAAHTHIIGPLQSGVQVISPGQIPDWSVTDGFDDQGKLLSSSVHQKNTLTCFHGRIPR